MRLYSLIDHNNCTKAAIELNHKLIFVEELNRIFNRDWPEKTFEIIMEQQLGSLKTWLEDKTDQILKSCQELFLDTKNMVFDVPYKHPSKIWGIGLNYVEHAGDLDEKAPTSIPASFVKTDTTVIGFGENIEIPKMSEKTTGEAELGIIIGKKCKNVPIENWLDVVAGFTTIIDVTAEDILRKNSRYLTISKNFDTFFSFGPAIITPDEISDIKKLEVSTILNGDLHAKNVVSNMTFPPDFLVSFHAQVMTLNPGDIISTGTPRATHINHGDQISCKITGFPMLTNPVVDLKK